MKIIVKKNKHVVDNVIDGKEFGCVCPNCGTVFIFNDYDVIKPRMINPTKHDFWITCPNELCHFGMTLDSKFITEFTKEFSKQDFKNKYDEQLENQ